MPPSLSPRPPPPPSFPYTTLFRSASGSVTCASLTEARLASRPMSGGNALAVSMSLVAGVAGTVQIAVMGRLGDRIGVVPRSEEHTSELQSRFDLVCRLLLEKKKRQ